MDWEKASPELGVYLNELLLGYDCQKKPMFGAPVYFVNDNMFAGVKGGKVFFRLPDNEQANIMAECDEVGLFEPRPNFFMKEYVQVPESMLTDLDFINRWLRLSFEYVSSFPPKEKKPKKKAK